MTPGPRAATRRAVVRRGRALVLGAALVAAGCSSGADVGTVEGGGEGASRQTLGPNP